MRTVIAQIDEISPTSAWADDAYWLEGATVEVIEVMTPAYRPEEYPTNVLYLITNGGRLINGIDPTTLTMELVVACRLKPLFSI